MTFRIVRLGLCAAFLIIAPQELCLAQDTVSSLTEDNVRTFIERTTEITGRKDSSMTTEEVLQYLQDHLDDDGRFKSILTYKVPDYPTQKNDMSLNKDQFIQSIVDGEKTLSSYDSTVKIKRVKISSDAKAATVETSSHETGVMSLQGEEGGTEQIPIAGDSDCTQILKLSAEGVIRMFNADCKTEITFQQPF